MKTAPPLKNDCFALPEGVEWTPVDAALHRLSERLHAVVGQEELTLDQGLDRILSAPVTAARSNPPYANSAVDGYGFAQASLPEGAVVSLPLVKGRAAAGEPFDGVIPGGKAIRILTGAQLPEGVDTVVLQEDVSLSANQVQFRAGLKRGANARDAGEDVVVGTEIFAQGHRLRAQDLALIAACGGDLIRVFTPLRVGVLSTGDEVIAAGQVAKPHQIYDANRPMLLAVLRKWGFVPVDLGHVEDSAEAVRAALSKGAECTDAILTSGGASAGDEDHISRVLSKDGDLQTWRVAIKPGRPLALALWKGVPVFGLPGNPVAAFVCTLIFSRPALTLLAGGGFEKPAGLMLPAAFSKAKKPGRREYLRARLRADGHVEVFASEGSGRISGLAWADGLVELEDAGREIKNGDLVRYYPYPAFGL